MTTITIDSLAYGGDAVGRLPDGRAAFVIGGCPGDRVKIEITEDRDRFVRGRVVDVVEASALRVTPPCPYFGVCGGCQWQHVAYAGQLDAKRSAVVDALRRIGKIGNAEELVASTVPSPTEYGYRNKIELVADPVAPRLTLGYHKRASAEVVPVELCLLVPRKHQKAPKAITGALRYISGENDLEISRIALRVARNTKDVEVAIWTPPGPFPRAAAAKVLGQALPLTSLVRVLHKGDPGKREVTKVEVLSGKGLWRERLAGHGYALSAPSFFQNNTALAEKLVELVLSALQPDGTDRVLDLYSGAGTFTLPLAAVAGEVVAVESSGPAIRDLRRNLESNELWAEAVGGDAAREIGELGHFDLVVVDPPRAGLAEPVLAALGSSHPRTMAYVSCDPATLARDAQRLEEQGLALTSVTPVDLFPQTYHVECVATFEPRQSS
ncbi:MAG TPA: 23S rRNA (uracil(1939)-C(5))-methyltransferase RlmD [Coriobacteriia bacterium]|nr:23S rRNA (uracil(1939)-C(5))-methyltransferase RlmD [Coriobacteriia bacterium]